MHTWYCICVHYWHIENNLKTALAGGLYAKGTWILESGIYKHYVLWEHLISLAGVETEIDGIIVHAETCVISICTQSLSAAKRSTWHYTKKSRSQTHTTWNQTWRQQRWCHEQDASTSWQKGSWETTWNSELFKEAYSQFGNSHWIHWNSPKSGQWIWVVIWTGSSIWSD